MSVQKTLHTIKYLQIAREIEAEIRECRILLRSPANFKLDRPIRQLEEALIDIQE